MESDNDIKHDICIEVLEEYLKAFKMSERAMRNLPASLTRKERTEEGRGLAKKPTAKDLDDFVLSQEEYGRICLQVNELTLKYNMLKSLVQSLSQKKALLVQLSANMRAEKNIYS